MADDAFLRDCLGNIVAVQAIPELFPADISPDAACMFGGDVPELFDRMDSCAVQSAFDVFAYSGQVGEFERKKRGFVVVWFEYHEAITLV